MHYYPTSVWKKLSYSRYKGCPGYHGLKEAESGSGRVTEVAKQSATQVAESGPPDFRAPLNPVSYSLEEKGEVLPPICPLLGVVTVLLGQGGAGKPAWG